MVTPRTRGAIHLLLMRTGFGFDGIWGCEEVFGPKMSLNGGRGSQKKAKTPLERRECADRSTESLLISFGEGVVRAKLLGKAGAAGALATAPSDIAVLASFWRLAGLPAA